MASPSPFDDLLKEFGDDAPALRRPPEDPLRGENLQKLLALSKKLEAVAKTLDPSDAKHPLNGQSVPEEARGRLKSLVSQLMDVQDALHTIEKTLLEEQVAEEITPAERPLNRDPFDDFGATPLPAREGYPPLDRRPQRDEPFPPEPDPFSRQRPFPEEIADVPPRHRGNEPAPSANEPERPSLDALDAITPSGAPAMASEEKAPSEQNPLPPPIKTQPSTTADLPTPPPPIHHDHAHLEQEKQAFETYKADWERVFAADPAQRAAHPEVQQYYDQMEAYFREKKAYINAKNPQP